MRPVAGFQPLLPLGIEVRPRPEFWYEKPDWDDRAIEREVDALLASGEVTIPPSRYPLLKSYNGATGQERRDGETNGRSPLSAAWSRR